jgi:uncharacterized membrane protein
MSIGPVQMLILGFEDPKFTGEGLAELERLREADIIRLVDLLAVQKDAEGNVTILQETQMDDDSRAEFGAVVGGLIGLGMAGEEGMEAGVEAGAEAAEGKEHLLGGGDEVWYAADAIPNNTAAVIALLEHRWAIPLRDVILKAGGMVLADEWIHAKDLVAVGMMAAEEAEAVTGA